MARKTPSSEAKPQPAATWQSARPDKLRILDTIIITPKTFEDSRFDGDKLMNRAGREQKDSLGGPRWGRQAGKLVARNY